MLRSTSSCSQYFRTIQDRLLPKRWTIIKIKIGQHNALTPADTKFHLQTFQDTQKAVRGYLAVHVDIEWHLLASVGVWRCLLVSYAVWRCEDGVWGVSQRVRRSKCFKFGAIWWMVGDKSQICKSTSTCFYNLKTMYIWTPKVTSHNLVLQSKSSCILQGASVGCHQTYF